MNFKHVTCAEDLVTTQSAVRAGFVAMALEKNKRSVPFVEEGRALKAAAAAANKPTDLLSMTSIRPSILTASGLSDKALNHLNEEDKISAIKNLIEQFLEPAGDDFVEELVYRFLLIKGDGLGGSMRNLAGSFAEQLFKRAIISALSIRKKAFYWQSKKFKRWIDAKTSVRDTEDVTGISWHNHSARTMVFNKNVALIKKNIDISLLASGHHNIAADLKDPRKYIILGEIKGGIDPAGADEHWKTARTAIERILDGFSVEELSIKTVFIGAAIERAMAEEMWHWLHSGKLSNAANLTNKDHVAAICNWIVDL